MSSDDAIRDWLAPGERANGGAGQAHAHAHTHSQKPAVGAQSSRHGQQGHAAGWEVELMRTEDLINDYLARGGTITRIPQPVLLPIPRWKEPVLTAKERPARKAKTIDFQGEQITIRALSERYGLSDATVRGRWQAGARGDELVAPKAMGWGAYWAKRRASE